MYPIDEVVSQCVINQILDPRMRFDSTHSSK